jgi:hypothetical protein
MLVLLENGIISLGSYGWWSRPGTRVMINATSTNPALQINQGGNGPYLQVGSNILTIANAGNVGIGTTTPVVPLHLNSGQFRIGAGATADVGTSQGVNVAGFGAFYGNIFLYGGSGQGLNIADISGPAVQFALNNRPLGITGGNVGIGTTAPGYNLDIAGALRLQPSSAPTGANGVIYYDSTANKFKCYEGGAWKDCISAGGGGELFVSASVPPQIINQGSYVVLARITVPTTKPNLKVIAVAVSPFYTFGAQGNARIELFNETDNLSVATWGSGAGPVYVEPNQVFDLGGKTVSFRLSHGAPAPQECWGSVSLKLMP